MIVASRAILCLLAIFTLGGCVSLEPVPQESGFVIVQIGEEDSTLVQRVVDHVSASYFMCPVRIETRRGAKLRKTMKGTVDGLEKLLGPNDLGILALIDVPGSGFVGSGVFRSKKVALLNTRMLRPESMITKKDGNRYLKRVQKESVRCLGLLIGLKSNSFPRCAMCEWRTEKELDAKGMNLSPPNAQKARKILMDMGVELAY